MDPKPEQLVEPFAGGAIVSLTAIMEGMVHQASMAEIDRDVAAFWKAVIHHNEELRARVREFQPTRESVNRLAGETPSTVVDWGFRTLVLNRTRRGGILANGAALNKTGENGKGLASRWYPETTIKRLAAISRYADRIEFQETDGLKLLEERLLNAGGDTVVFADPPYTAGGKRAGARLYNSNHVDHQRLFSLLSNSGVEFLMTYDKSPEILSLIREHGFKAVQVLMRNTHHAKVPELVITRGPVFDP
jgi:DNA adenine methylase